MTGHFRFWSDPKTGCADQVQGSLHQGLKGSLVLNQRMYIPWVSENFTLMTKDLTRYIRIVLIFIRGGFILITPKYSLEMLYSDPAS